MSFEDCPVLLDQNGCAIKNDTRLFPANVPFSKNVTKREFHISIHGCDRDDLREKDEEISEYEKNPSPKNWRVDSDFIGDMAIEDPLKFKKECRYRLLNMLFLFEESCRKEFRKENIDEIKAFEDDWNHRMRDLKREKGRFEDRIDERMSEKYKEQIRVFKKLLEDREERED